MAETYRGEAWRKLVHLGTIVVPLWMWWVPWPWMWRGLLLAFLGVLALDVARITVPAVGRWFASRVGGSLRQREQRALISVHALTGAALFLALVAPVGIAVTAVAYLVVGDAAAALVGRKLGRHRLGRKSLEGSLACFVACLLVGAVVLQGPPRAIAGGALAATIAEALPAGLDDNWTVPLVSAAVLALLV